MKDRFWYLIPQRHARLAEAFKAVPRRVIAHLYLPALD